MCSNSNIYNIEERNDPTYVLVSSGNEIENIIKEYPNKDIIFRLQLSHFDEELLYLLENIPYKIEIIYNPLELRDNKLQQLYEFKERTSNKVFIIYNIDKKSAYDRANLIYYLNRYDLISLLKTSNKDIYQDWVIEMTKYISKNKVRKLNCRYINTKVV